jgi:hypothetical protein
MDDQSSEKTISVAVGISLPPSPFPPLLLFLAAALAFLLLEHRRFWRWGPAFIVGRGDTFEAGSIAIFANPGGHRWREQLLP